MTTFDPDTLERDNRVLAGLARERENLFGVYARVCRAGWAEVGASGAASSAVRLTARDGLTLTNRRGVEQSGSSSGS